MNTQKKDHDVKTIFNVNKKCTYKLIDSYIELSQSFFSYRMMEEAFTLGYFPDDADSCGWGVLKELPFYQREQLTATDLTLFASVARSMLMWERS